jgi:hypothetical protein
MHYTLYNASTFTAFRRVTAAIYVYMLSRIIITTSSGDIRKRFVTVTSGLNPTDVEFIPQKSVTRTRELLLSK